jgi:hypothetical protein
MHEALRRPETWFVVLAVAGCVIGPYLFGVPPWSAKQRVYLAITIAFLAWILPLMAPLR